MEEPKLTDKFWHIVPETKSARQPSPAPATVTIQPEMRREFSAATYSRLTASMENSSEHIMRVLRYQGRPLRARSRQIIDNNPYGAKFAQMCVSNICGPDPFTLQSKIKNSRGKLDNFANTRVESEWRAWGRPGGCDYLGRLSWADLQRLAVRTLVTDGEVIFRIWEGSQHGPWGLQLQLIDSDRLDEDRNQVLTNGNTIVNGVEVDGEGRIVAYWFLKSPPRSWQLNYTKEYIRVDAAQIIHLFIPHRAEQVRGIPWTYAAIMNLYQMGKAEEAAVIAFRVGASKMGFYTTPDGTPASGTVDPNTGTAVSGSINNAMQSAEPGVFDVLPDGYGFTPFDPQFPDAAYGPFTKALLRGVACGFNVSYTSLGNDLEGVNLSSIRAGLLEERDFWRMIQNWLIEHLHQSLYERWLLMANLTGRLSIQGALSKYHDIQWQPKRWPWIDPLKDMQANIEAIKWALKSRTKCLAETDNGDIETILNDLASEQEMAAEKNVKIVEEKKETGGTSDAQPDDQATDDQESAGSQTANA